MTYEEIRKINRQCKDCKHYRFFGLCYFQSRLIPKEPNDWCDIIEDLFIDE